MKNLTQSTYDRICRKLRDNSDRHARSLTSTDASDLLLAYEGAMDLLDQLLGSNRDLGGSDLIRDVHNFLLTPSGHPRVFIENNDDDEIAG